ncbi:hypothetical protein [Novosphingobium aquimarinum]|uniref:hypothetical protein n=1 Tax=Novosphingobium aquimarinum TaxID=2682494 RepID=UPI0012EB7791|nr:hypothetical protein [Novosphingobium aquimarinum]
MIHRVVLAIAASAVFALSADLQARELAPVLSSDIAMQAIVFELKPGPAKHASSEASFRNSHATTLEAKAGDEPGPGTGQISAVDEHGHEAAAIAAARTVAEPGDEKARPGPAIYQEPQTAPDRHTLEKTGWTRDLVALEIAFQMANALDAITTQRCLRRDRCKEVNPLFGKHPSTGMIYGTKAAAGLAHYFAIDMLSDSSPATARAVAWVTTIFQTGVVGINMSRTF